VTIIWEWLPNSNLGPIKLGNQISDYYEKFHLMKNEDIDNTGWVRYKFPSFDTYIDVENEIIVSISTYEELIYKDKNIIGIQKNDLVNVLGSEPDEVGDPVLFDDGDLQTSYDYFDLGLQLWISNGVVVSASCVNYSI